MADTSGGSGGGVSSFLTYSYDQMKEMAYADDPEAIDGHAAQWAQAARDLRIFQQMLHEELGSIGAVYNSPAGAPALIHAVSERASKLGDVAANFERNSQAMNLAASALRTAQAKLEAIEPQANPETGIAWRDATQMGPMAQQAAPVMDELATAYDLARNELEFKRGDIDDPDNGARNGGGLSTYVSAPGAGGSSGGGPAGLISRRTGGPGLGGRPTLGAAPGRTPPTGGGHPPATASSTGGALRGTAAGTRGTASASGAGTRTGGGTIRVPGARGGMPIGGYRPGTGTTGAGAAQPGGSSPGHGGPGGPGRPGAAPPMGHGAGAPGGKDRGGRRLTNYERLEPDTFRDTRPRTKPVIGEQRRTPDTFTPTPGVIGAGTKQTSDAPEPRTPEMPTKEAPKRFEGHDMSVSFNRRPRRGP